MNRQKFLLKNIGLLTVSNFASKILIFLLVPLYTSVLSTAEYGSYDLAVSTATLLYPVLSLNIVDAVMRYTMDKGANKKSIATIGLRFLLSSIFVFCLVVGVMKVTGVWADLRGLELYIALYYISYVFNQYLIQFAKGLERVKDMMFAGVLSTLVTVATNILFLLVFKWGLPGFFFANILAQALSALFLAVRVKLWSYIDFRQRDATLQREMLAYSVPLIATVVGWWVNSTSDKYVVSIMMGVAANGLLSVAYKIPSIISVFQSIFTQAWQISAVKEYGEGDTANFYGNTFTLVNLLVSVACSCLIILTRPMAYVFFAKDFYVAWLYVPFLLVSSVLNCASGLLGPILAAQKNSKAMMWSAVIGAGSNVVLNIVLVYFTGIQGACIATMICSYLIYHVRWVAVGESIRIKDYHLVVFTWLALVAQTCVEVYTTQTFFELLILGLIIFVNKEYVFKTITLCRTIMQKRRNHDELHL